MNRRDWFERVARGGAAGGALVLAPGGASGGDPGDLADEDFTDALARLGASDAAPDPAIVLELPEAAWTGAFVSVRIDASALVGVRALHLLRDGHVPAAVVAFEPRGALPAVLSLPIRLERPCRLRALVALADGWRYRDGRVRTLGAPGCG